MTILDQCSRDSKFTEPTTIKRYIDDIASVFNDYYSALLFINTYNSIRPNSISVTYHISSESGIFLDIEFYKGDRLHLGKLDTRVYQKPSNQYLYIPPMSYHNPVVFKSFIKAEIKRYYLLSSTHKEFLIIKELFYQRLLTRGYSHNQLNNIFESTKCENRHILLKQKFNNQINKNQNKSNDNAYRPLVISVPISARTRLLKLGHILSNFTHDAVHDPNFYAIFGCNPTRVIVCYKRGPNLGDLLRSSTYSYLVTLIPPPELPHINV